MSDRWLTLACPGTWNAHKTDGEYDKDFLTHVQVVFDLMPPPKLQLPGLGKKHGVGGKLIGGAFGVGVGDRVDNYMEFLQSQSFDRVLMIGGSRGCGVEGAILQEMERERDLYWKQGKPAPPWCRVDCLVMIDPVLSFGIHGAFKKLISLLPKKLERKASWHFNVDRYRKLPGFVKNFISIYSLDDDRTAFEPTHFRVTAADATETKLWLRGVHSDLLGYGPNPEQVLDAGSWLRYLLSEHVPDLIDANWPFPQPALDHWKKVPAQPVCRRHIPGDFQMVKTVAALLDAPVLPVSAT